ncbi:PREDICTED: putative cyclin-D6-1 [Camelina sativa]|uniref:Cyclin-D6-1 n=1 Tax=Camelina sativa TaxID=90675 RepID=A0ABM0T8H0_CAMSA|nr:PREDICTED: putative cyclin-D6-1 [Camelina sativa]
MEFHLEHPLSHSSLHSNSSNDDDTDDETLPHSLFLVEFQHMPSSHYFHTLKSSAFLISNRNHAISSIIQYSRKLDDPSLTYLAVNYLDRFLSSEDMPQPKPWILKLISLSCVSLSAKMRKPDMSVSHLPAEEGEFFDAHMIERMENVILGALKWRMRSVTPFSFFALFISLFELKDDSLVTKHSLKSQAIDLTFNLQHDFRFLEFKPSVVAGAALLFASFQLCPLQFPCFSNRICQCTYVDKDELMECYKAIQERDHIVEENEGSNETAVNVLDQQFSSCESDKSITITASSPKRRKTSSITRRC